MGENLDHLLAEARAAAPDQRIKYRDPIAEYGEEAVKAIAPWLQDERLGLFAVRVMLRVADQGSRPLVVATLRDALTAGPPDKIKADIEDQLAHLAPPRAKRQAKAVREIPPALVMSPEELVVGRVYRRRRDLHAHGLGGNWQKGISYPADGHYVLLFSDPSREADYGYRDSWLGHERYRYYGEWDGTGDMTMTGGNAAIQDRSPELYLFVAAPGGHRFEGRFALESYGQEPAVREGRQFMAIVFQLVRAETNPQ